MPTSVPRVRFGPNGFVAPAESDVLAGVIADVQAAFGGKLNLSLTTPSSLSTPQGQLASSEAAAIANANEVFLFQSTQTDPAFAEGRWQDAIARIYFINRLPAEPTVLQVACFGGVGVVIPVNASIADASGNLYVCTQEGVIQGGGSVTLPFAALVPGPVAVPGDVSIYQAIPAWDSVDVISGVVGQNTETRSQFEARRQQSVAKNSVGQLSSVLGAVLAVPGVLDVYVNENNSSLPAVVGGYSLTGNSIYVAVVGGNAQAIAKAIWSKRSPGAAYNGNTVVAVVDDNPAYSAPLPTYQVTFERPDPLAVLFSVQIVNGPQVPATAAAQIKAAIQAAFSGADGGARARIGSKIFASRFVTPVLELGAWAQIASIAVGSNNTPSAQFIGSVSNTTLTVTSVMSGALAPGQTLSDATGALAVGTIVGSQLTGTLGGIGTYALLGAQVIVSEPMTAAVASQQIVTARIDQVPTLADNNISVSLI